MIKRLVAIILLFALAVTLFSSCAPRSAEVERSSTGTYTDYIDSGKVIAAQIGDVYGTVAAEIFKAKQVQEFTLVPDMLEAVLLGKVDAAILDDAYVKQIQDSGQYPDLDYLPVPTEVFVNMASNVFHTEELRDKFNEWFETIVSDGTFDEIYSRWIGSSLPDEKDIPRFELTGENGTLKVCNTGNFPPFSYVDSNNIPVGFDEEILNRFAQYMGMDIEYNMMAYDAIIPFVLSGKADMSGCAFTVTDERSDGVLFGTPFPKAKAMLAIKKSGYAAARDFSDLSGKRIGVITGSFFDTVVEEKLHATPVYYQDDIAALEDVRKGRIDGVMCDNSKAIAIMAESGNEGLEIIAVPAEVYSGPMGAISADEAVINSFNAFLQTVEADGTLAEMQRRWLEENPGSDPSMPDVPSSGENGIIKVATTGSALPFSYTGANGELKGYCIELALRFAANEGKTVEFITLDTTGMIPYVASGKADIGIDAIAITEEREESILFSEPHYHDLVGVLVLKGTAIGGKTEGGLLVRLKTSIERNLLTDNRWKMIVDGLGVTMIIAVLAQLFGTALGCFVCWLLTRKNKAAKAIAELYCGLIQRTPIVVLLMISYYIIFGTTNISNVLVAVAAFTMITGAGVAVILKGAIETIDPVEIEAARSIGFSAFGAFLTVTLPQAVKRALPGYTNGFVELVKATAIVGYIAIQDLTRAGDIIRSRTYDAYFPLLFIAVIYLLVITLCVELFKLIVKKVNKVGVDE